MGSSASAQSAETSTVHDDSCGLSVAERAAFEEFWRRHSAESSEQSWKTALAAVGADELATLCWKAAGKAEKKGLELLLSRWLEPDRHLDELTALLQTERSVDTVSRAVLVAALRVSAEAFWRRMKQRDEGAAAIAGMSEAEAKLLDAVVDAELASAKEEAQPTQYSRKKLAALCKRCFPTLGSEGGALVLHLCCGTRNEWTESGVVDRWGFWRLQSLPVRPDHVRHGWDCLYSSKKNGEGLSSVARAIFFYPAPTVVLVRTTCGEVVGFYTEEEWRNGGDFFGRSSSFLFSLSPELRVYRSTGYSKNYCYFHLPSTKAGLAGVVTDGMGFGGQLESFRFWMDADLSKGVACMYDSTFENGQMCPVSAAKDVNPESAEFQVAALEVYGLGGPQARAMQDMRAQKEVKEAMKRRQVNRKIALGGEDEDNVDMWLMEVSGAHTSFVKDANHVE